MKTLDDIKAVLNSHKGILKEKYGIRRIWIFGSYSRNESIASSDIDIVVEFEETIGMKFFEVWDYLEEILGTKVDLLTINSIKQKSNLWENVKKEMIGV